jgi:hypothetical protein
MAHFYTLVVSDGRERGFDRMAQIMAASVEGRVGCRLDWISNPLVPAPGAPDDFDAITLQHGTVLDSLNAEDEPESEDENLKALVGRATVLLTNVRERVESKLGDEYHEDDGLGDALERCLDYWDSFVRSVENDDD